jgi:PIN domain nuclease of toxin-antitoxin system
MMRLLLDTHALLWWQTDDARLSTRARAAIANETNEIFVSAASAWGDRHEGAIGKLDGVPQAVERFESLLRADGFRSLPIDDRHALRAGGVSRTHRDPFDRMLAAQSELEALTLVSIDPAFSAFGTRTLW